MHYTGVTSKTTLCLQPRPAKMGHQKSPITNNSESESKVTVEQHQLQQSPISLRKPTQRGADLESLL